MTLNTFFSFDDITQGAPGERDLLRDLIEETIQINGQLFLYIPRTLVAKDEVLGEDRLSTFNHAHGIEMYIENPTQFNGQGNFLNKFGLNIEQSISLVVSRKRWNEVVGLTSTTILPQRPAEGDLIYSPLTKRLFEIKYVDTAYGFWTLGEQQAWRLSVETFRYSSERLNTGNTEVDAFETLRSFDQTKLTEAPDAQGNVGIDRQDNFGDNRKLRPLANVITIDKNNPFGDPI